MEKPEKKKSQFKILVIDDSTLSLSAISDILRSYGYSAIETSNTPLDGLKKFNSDTFYLCIIDVVMPKISGIDIAKERM